MGSDIRGWEEDLPEDGRWMLWGICACGAQKTEGGR